MITEKDIKPIPKYILKLIKERDKKDFPNGDGQRRFYAYLTKFGGELVKVTVAVKNRNNKARDWVHKQVAVHCVHSDRCLIKDMVCYYIAGYVVGWFEQGLYRTPKWFEQENWWEDYYTIEPVAPIVNTEYASEIQIQRSGQIHILRPFQILADLRRIPTSRIPCQNEIAVFGNKQSYSQKG